MPLFGLCMQVTYYTKYSGLEAWVKYTSEFHDKRGIKL